MVQAEPRKVGLAWADGQRGAKDKGAAPTQAKGVGKAVEVSKGNYTCMMSSHMAMHASVHDGITLTGGPLATCTLPSFPTHSSKHWPLNASKA